MVPGFPDGRRELPVTLLRDGVVRRADFKAGFYDHRLLSEAFIDVEDVRDAVSDDPVRVVAAAFFGRPVRIEGHSDHIVLCPVLLQQAEVPVVHRLVVAVVEMDEGDHVREDALRGAVAGVDKAGVLFRVELAVAHMLRDWDVVRVKFRLAGLPPLRIPEQPVARLVADLHPFRLDAVILQVLQHLDRMVIQVLLHRLVVVSEPGGRNRLVLRVRPGVRIMEIHHDRHSQLLRPQAILQQILLIAHPRIRDFPLRGLPPAARIHPDAVPRRIQPQLLHQRRQLVGLLSFETLQPHAARLHPVRGADIRAQPVLRRFRLPARKDGCQHSQCGSHQNHLPDFHDQFFLDFISWNLAFAFSERSSILSCAFAAAAFASA